MSAIERKWKKYFEDKKVFEAEPDKRPKFFVTAPYPYINAAPHVGHSYTYIRIDMLAKFYRLKGYNVLFPIGLHATGEPIVGVSKRLMDGDEKQIKALKLSGVKDSVIKTFKDPKNIVKYFAKVWIKDFGELGLSVDWRRTFHTTSLNPEYNQFVTWQFNLLKQKGFITKGEHPVVYCPRDQSPTGSHDRLEGENAMINEFYLLKFELEPKKYLVTATLRPETIFGTTNLWMKPNTSYSWIKVNNEEWLISTDLKKDYLGQYDAIDLNQELNSNELLYQSVNANFINKKLDILPASFIDPSNGSGIVLSVPSDSTTDYAALVDLQKSGKALDLSPIPIIQTSLGNLSAKKSYEELKIKNQEDLKLSLATKRVYKNALDTGRMLPISGKYNGLSVEDARNKIGKDLLKNNIATKYFQTSEQVVCRCGTSCFVKKLKNQWFINYGDPKWKKQVLDYYEEMNFYPIEAKNWMKTTTKGMKAKPCARKSGLGTPLPWDPEWIVEPLSDSTIYPSYYTISKFIYQKKLQAKNMTKEFFDYVLLGKGKIEQVSKKTGLKQTLLKNVQKEFLYYYPVDLRSTGKDLLSHHMIFYVYNHIAIFPKKHWPKSAGANGWVTVDGMKMSKSKGNFIPLRTMIKDYGTDASRLTFLDSAEGLGDPDFDRKKALNLKDKLQNNLKNFKKAIKKAEKRKENTQDKLLISKLQISIQKSTQHLKKMENRQAIFYAFHQLNNTFNDYIKKVKPNKKVLTEFIKTYAILNSPFIPTYACEYYSLVSDKFLFNDSWPVYDKKRVDNELLTSEKIINNVISDAKKIIFLTGMKPTKILIITSGDTVNTFLKDLKKVMETKNDLPKIIKSLKNRPTGQEVKMIQAIIKDRSKLPATILNENVEQKILKENTEYLEKELKTKIIIQSNKESTNIKKLKSRPLKPAIILQ